MANPLPIDKESPPSAWWSGTLMTGLFAYALTSSIVVLGVSFGHQFVAPPGQSGRRSFREGFTAQDGEWYKSIATRGYYYDPHKRSSVAFFPLFPLLGADAMYSTGMEPTWALLLVSHLCLAVSFVAAAVYLCYRLPPQDQTTVCLTLLALGLMPATFFFRMTYSESTFLLLSLLFLLGVQRGWSLPAVASIAGLASACRPVGVALLPPLLLYTWRRAPNHRVFLARAALAVPVGCWGLLAYASFLYVRFGEPLAFAKTQTHWGSPAPSLTTKMLALFSYQPIWEIFLRGPDAGWSVFTWELVNPTYFLASIALLAFGAWRGWLNGYETLLASVLLLIPYLTRAYEMNMASSARFAAVVFPVYIVLGRGLARFPPIVIAALFAISAFFLGAFSALFAAGYSVF